MTAEKYWETHAAVLLAGYADEITWQRELTECNNHVDFLHETCWVILNSGMREQVARVIWDRIKQAWNNKIDISEAFKHKGKVAAMKFVRDNCRGLFDGYLVAENKIEYLQTIPFIGKITCYHLAKNLGHDCVKPDRHLVRLANYENTTPVEMCEQLSKSTGEKKSVIDIVLWRACNLKIL